MFSRFFNPSLPHAVDALVGPAVTLLEPMPDFGAFGTDDPSLLAVTGSVIIIHVTSHALNERNILPELEILWREIVHLKVQTFFFQDFCFGLGAELDFHDPHTGIFP